MNKKIRNWMIVGGCLLILGVVLSGIGYVNGAWEHRELWSVSVSGSNRVGIWVDEDGEVGFGVGSLSGRKKELAQYEATEEIKVTGGVGNVNLDGASCDRLIAECGTGSIWIGKSGIRERADLNSGVGDLELELAGSEDDYNFEISCGLGEATIGDLFEMNGMGGEKKLDQGQSCWIHAKNGIGDLEISFSED